jgi:hypothetical protein
VPAEILPRPQPRPPGASPEPERRLRFYASRLFIPFFQAADQGVLRPATLIPPIAWRESGWIAGLFALVLVAAQAGVLWTALRRGVLQALRLAIVRLGSDLGHSVFFLHSTSPHPGYPQRTFCLSRAWNV